jgi:hypothetical protein
MRIGALLMAALLVLSPVALASDTFTDPSGDSGGDPDITSVTLSHTDATLTIAVELGSVPPLTFSESDGYTDMLLIGIHTDEDLSRTDVEFWTGVHAVDITEAMVVRGGSGRGVVGTADVSVSGATLALEVERDLLDDPNEIAVQVAVGRESAPEGAASGRGDEAPDSGSYAYVLGDDGAPAWLWPVVGAAAAATIAGLVLLRALRPGRPRRVRMSH